METHFFQKRTAYEIYKIIRRDVKIQNKVINYLVKYLKIYQMDWHKILYICKVY